MQPFVTNPSYYIDGKLLAPILPAQTAPASLHQGRSIDIVFGVLSFLSLELRRWSPPLVRRDMIWGCHAQTCQLQSGIAPAWHELTGCR